MYERVLFVALIFLSAYLLKTIKLFREEDSKVFINYVLYFSLPALVLEKVREVKIGTEAFAVVLTAWAVITTSILLSLLLGRLMGMEERSLRSFVLVSSFGNTAFMGYPFTFAFFGDEGLRYAVLYDQLGSFLLVISVGFFVATGRFSLREILTFPPFIALGLAFLLRSYQLPQVLETFFEISGRSLIPVVLFAVGLKFSFGNLFASLKGAFLSVSVKMLFVPLLLLIVFKLLGLSGLSYKVAFLESAMPPMVMAGVLAIKYGLDESLAISAITLGMVLSFFTVPLLLSLL